MSGRPKLNWPTTVFELPIVPYSSSLSKFVILLFATSRKSHTVMSLVVSGHHVSPTTRASNTTLAHATCSNGKSVVNFNLRSNKRSNKYGHTVDVEIGMDNACRIGQIMDAVPHGLDDYQFASV